MSRPWKIIHIDVAEEPPSLEPDPAVEGLFIVCWYKNLPLAHLEIEASTLPVSSATLREGILEAIVPTVGSYLFDRGFRAPLPVTARYALADPAPPATAFKGLEHPLERITESLKYIDEEAYHQSVSVVICTRNRSRELERCLASLKKLRYRPDEIIVVDNAPETGEVKRVVEKLGGVRYIPEPRPGLSSARNTGVYAARSKIIAFTDDDVEVHPDWLLWIRAGFQDSEVRVVTGLVMPAVLDTEAQRLFEHDHGGTRWGYRPIVFDDYFFSSMKHRGVPVWQVGAGANMAIRRDAFTWFGGFDERLGAGTSGCSEDSEFWYRVLANGGKCRYDPRAVVFHYHRSTLPELEHQLYEYMKGHVTALLVQYEKHGHIGNLVRTFGVLPHYYTRLLLRRIRSRSSHHPQFLRAQIQGCAAGLAFYLRNRLRNGQAKGQ